MRRWWPLLVVLALIAIVGLLGLTAYNWLQIPFLRFNLAAGQCKFGPPLAGVYIPSRLHVIDRCLTVSGTVDCLKVEPDGDVHLRVRLHNFPDF